MTDKDRYVDETLKKQIQDAYGASDEQLKARMDRIERTLTDDEFAGAEDRIMAKLMARIGAPERKEETVKTVTEVVAEAAEKITEEVTEETSGVYEVVAEVETETPIEIPENGGVLSESAEIVSEVEEETSAIVVAGEEKVVRFGRKKVILVAALAAAFIGTLAVTTIGENNYFFREDERRVETIFDSGKNISDVSSLEEAYVEIKNQLNNPIFALGHLPEDMKFESLTFDGNKAIIKLVYKENNIYFIQWLRDIEASIGLNSDRGKWGTIYNKWLETEIVYEGNKLSQGHIEAEAQFESEGMVGWIFGKMDINEFEEMLKNIYFY